MTKYIVKGKVEDVVEVYLEEEEGLHGVALVVKKGKDEQRILTLNGHGEIKRHDLNLPEARLGLNSGEKVKFDVDGGRLVVSNVSRDRVLF